MKLPLVILTASAALLSVVAVPGFTPLASAAPLEPCSNSSVVAIDAIGDIHRWRIANPLNKVSIDSKQDVGGRAYNIRMQAQVSDNLLFSLNRNDGGYTAYKLGSKEYAQTASGGSGWSDVTRLIPQGRGVFYAIHSNGDMTMHKISVDGTAVESKGRIGSGWNKYTHVVGTGWGHVYAYRGNEMLHFYRPAWDSEKGEGFGQPEVSKGTLPEMTDLQGLGTGVLMGFAKDGTAFRVIVEGNKFTAGNTESRNWNVLRDITVAPGHCGTPPTPEVTASVPDGPITRSQILSRGKFWFDRDVPYSQEATYPDELGVHYRTDCSGYVAMAWHMKDDKQGNFGSPTVSEIVNGYTRYIDYDELQPGDALASSGHIVLFVEWANSSHTAMRVWEQMGTIPDMQDHSRDLNELSGYRAIRYNNVVD